MKGTFLLQSALLGLQASLSTQLSIPRAPQNITAYPTTTIANVTVVDTELVRQALTFARGHSNDIVWNHVMRGWLYGTLIYANNATLRKTVDAEAHALAAILHDLGWDQTPNSPVVSPDRRFEVDGAIAARDFIRQHTHDSSAWDDNRLQLVWDSIALHSQESIYKYKQDTVMVTGTGISVDLEGVSTTGISLPEYDAVGQAFPRTELRQGVNETFIWLCASKPSSTWGTFMQPFGDHYVANYSAVGHRVFDIINDVKD
ncbi:hypothetical protein GGR50DRAFT_301872 [Xylaria sp. CBS 124048]|nr:hypothetical protein GGR50DRAFT_301872 [Xylaria sp. CBS 124048]